MKRLLLILALAFSFTGFSEAKIHRSMSARHHFMVQTGYPHGRKGYIVDHIVPLCSGGADDPANMQWQTVEDAKAKDRLEKALCALERAADKARAHAQKHKKETR